MHRVDPPRLTPPHSAMDTSFFRTTTSARMASRGMRCWTIVGSVIRCDDPMPEGNWMNKAELRARVAARTSISKPSVDAAMSAVFSTNADALASGETVTIAGVGTFSKRSRLAHQDRNPRTGNSIAITASNTPSFKGGKNLRDTVNYMCVAVRSFATEFSNRSLRYFSTYKATLRSFIGFVLVFSVFQNSAALADGTVQSSVKENLVTFEKLAVNICQSVPTKSSKEELSLSVNGKAELSKLIKIIAGIDAEIEFDIESDKTTGVLQRDLANVIVHSNSCRLEVLKIIIEFVKSHSSRSFPKPQGRNSANASKNSPRDDTRKFRVNQIITALVVRHH